MQKDSELDSILQEARESYQKRIEELKFSLKTISSQEKDVKSEFEKFSPFKNVASDSLRYSTTFRPNNTEEKKEPKDPQNEEHGLGQRLLNNSVFDTEKTKQDLQTELKQLKRELSDTKENLQRMKKNYEDSENRSSDLRDRVKELTLSLNRVTEENSKLKELRSEPNVRDLQNLKIHYKKKVSRMREELLHRDTEYQKIKKELENLSRRETSIRQVCETQVKEISEEYVKSLKQAGTVHHEEMVKLKCSFEIMTETQVQEFLKEMEKMKTALVEYERTNRAYQEKFERIIVAKEKAEKVVMEKEQLLTQSQLTVQQLRKEVEKFQNLYLAAEKSLKDKENQLTDSQFLIQKLKSEFERVLSTKETNFQEQEKSFEFKFQQLAEENKKKQTYINKLIEELEREERLMKKLKQDYELQLEDERSKNYSIELETSKMDSLNNDLAKTLENLKYRNSLLEDQLSTQSIEFRKKQDLEANRQNERIKGLETELKSLYSANAAQAREMEALRQLCGEIEEKQEQELKDLMQKHEDHVKEIKKHDRNEYLQLCEALEATKISLHSAENNLDKYETLIKEMKTKEKGYLSVVKNVESYKLQTEEAVAQYRVLGLKYSKSQTRLQNLRDVIFSRFKKTKDSYKLCIKNSLDLFQEFKSFQEKSLPTMLKSLVLHVESLKNAQISAFQKVLTENQSLKSALEKSRSQVSMLESELQSYSTQNKILCDQNNQFKRTLESNDPIAQKTFFTSVIKTFLSYLSALESSTNESYTELEASVMYLKEFITQETLQARLKQQDTVEQAKKSIDFYRDKLIKLENEKTVEVNKSQSELFGLQQRLSQVLEDIRDQKF